MYIFYVQDLFNFIFAETIVNKLKHTILRESLCRLSSSQLDDIITFVDEESIITALHVWKQFGLRKG